MFKYIISFIFILFCFSEAAILDSLYTKNILDGVNYYNYILSNGPMRLHVLEIDINKKSLKIDVGVTGDTIGSPRLKTSEMYNLYSDKNKKMISSINGDFFGGKPMQFENNTISDGKILKSVKLNRSQIAFDNNNKPFIEMFNINSMLIHANDTFKISKINSIPNENEITMFTDFMGSNYVAKDSSLEIIINQKNINLEKSKLIGVIEKKQLYNKGDIPKGKIIINLSKKYKESFEKMIESDTVEINIDVLPQLKINSLIGGYPRLITNGKIPESFIGIEGMKNLKFIDKNPRTAIGFNIDTTKVYFVVVDGRQENFSVGMSLEELAKFMLSIGITNAINLDGGGSSSFVLEGKVMNSPSDKTGERPVCNAVILYSE